MTIEKRREVPRAQPFESFTIHVVDGRDVPVPHPDFVSVDPRGCVAHVFHQDRRSEFIDFMLVTSIDLGDGNYRDTGQRRSR